MNDMAVDFKRYPFTVDEYHRMFEVGVLDESAAVELINGELIKMPPIGPEHFGRHSRITKYLVETFANRATIVPMGSFRLGDHDEPQPDVAILPYDGRAYEDGNLPRPEAFYAFIEIAVTSFHFDARVKMALYAARGIPNYLLVDVDRNRMILHANPTSDGYASIREVTDGEFALDRTPDVPLSVGAFLRYRSV